MQAWEIAVRRKRWVKQYHRRLSLIPVAVVVLVFSSGVERRLRYIRSRNVVCCWPCSSNNLGSSTWNGRRILICRRVFNLFRFLVSFSLLLYHGIIIILHAKSPKQFSCSANNREELGVVRLKSRHHMFQSIAFVSVKRTFTLLRFRRAAWIGVKSARRKKKATHNPHKKPMIMLVNEGSWPHFLSHTHTHTLLSCFFFRICLLPIIFTRKHTQSMRISAASTLSLCVVLFYLFCARRRRPYRMASGPTSVARNDGLYCDPTRNTQ